MQRTDLPKFPMWKVMIYSLGTMGQSMLDRILLTFSGIFYLAVMDEGEAVSGLVPLISNENLFGIITVFGVVFLIGRIIDSLADPIVATLSDRSRSRLGRRRFWLFISGLPLAASCILVFYPPLPEMESMWNAVYLGSLLAIFFIAYTGYVAPYLALIPELGHTEKERLNIVTIHAVFMLIGAAVVFIGTWFFIGVLIEEGTPAQNAYQITITITGVIAFFLLYAAFFIVDEKKYCLSVPSSVKLVDSVKMTMSNKGFLYYLFGNISLQFVFNIISSNVPFYTITLMRKKPEDIALLMIIIFAFAFVFFIPINYATKKLGKRKMMIICGVIFFITLNFIYVLGTPPFDSDIFTFGLFGCIGIAVAILLVLPNAILSEIAHLDALKTGQQREGMFFGVQGLFMKVNIGLSVVVFSALFSVFGKDVGNDLGVRLTGPVSAFFALIGVILFLKYPESRIEDQLVSMEGEEVLQ